MPDWDEAQTTLEGVYARWYPILLQRAAADVAADLGRPVDLDPALTDPIMAAIGEKVQGVLDTQRQRLAALINTYAGDPAGLAAAVQGVLDTTADRAAVIARSEVTHAFNQGTALACQSAGVRVAISDGDADAECAAVNGTIQDAAWLLANPSGHPNCQRRGYPVSE